MTLRIQFATYCLLALLLSLDFCAAYTYWNNRASSLSNGGGGGVGDDFELDQIRQYLSRHHQLNGGGVASRDGIGGGGGIQVRQRFYNPFHNYFYPDQQQQEEGRAPQPQLATAASPHSNGDGVEGERKAHTAATSSESTGVHLSRVESIQPQNIKGGEVVPDNDVVMTYNSHSRHTRPSAHDQPDAVGVDARGMPQAAERASDVFFVAVVAGCSAAAVFGVVAAGFCWYRIQKSAKAAAEAEYPAYGVTGPNRETSPGAGSGNGGDRKLAQSAHMYHYHHQKQQMIAMEKATTGGGERHVSTSDIDSEEDNEEGDYTVYECPGLAPTAEMEVKNPLFQEEETPAISGSGSNSSGNNNNNEHH